jgi:death-on-curing protein
MRADGIVFLTLSEVVEIHSDQIERFGGDPGIRDRGLLSSAIAVPYATFQQSFLHEDIFEMAAAYAFHICQNRPFIDENKRTALAAALVFLGLNDVEPADPRGTLYHAMMSLASGSLSKAELATVLKELMRIRSEPKVAPGSTWCPYAAKLSVKYGYPAFRREIYSITAETKRPERVSPFLRTKPSNWIMAGKPIGESLSG